MVLDKKTRALDDLRMQILSLWVTPGADLDEAALCAQYGVSRTPMREVFQRLAGEGYLELGQNRAPKVASMDLPTLRMFFQTAPLVYANIARLAAENRRADQIAPLRAVQDQFRRATEARDAGAAALLNHSFHAQIGAMSHNPYLRMSLGRMLIDHTRLSQTFYRPSSPEDTSRIAIAADQHDAMIDAIEARDAEAATALTLAHWDLSRDRIERFVTPDPLPLDVATLKETADAL
ncbi:GntR family transcriptional regulator [Roseovarius sp. LXJ103]|uniref:GntR family transcriptional regulator n=1 Tax=Roseovarius carneus TaxID=2853164 RepID=UPI000D60CEC4|nr:GntR family transcriptional regulator [Roseovarius carneus]MBZ8117829.1 GntR family transcriptional regulator [Roseovarius carneus]PWE36407.1 GntR family transcriptional regulator [Pelagicola sp. LXJ1103]